MSLDTISTWTMNVSAAQHTLSRENGMPADVQPKIEASLDILLTNAGKVVPRQALLETVCVGESDPETELTITMGMLRRLLNDDSLYLQSVETVRGEGYRLINRFPVSATGTDSPQGRQLDYAQEVPVTDTEGSPVTFVGELVRRRVFKVLGGYLLVGWGVLQIGDLIFEPLGIPVWCMTLLVLLVALGLPVAAVLAWAIQVTPAGLVLDMPGAQPGCAPVQSRTRGLRSLIIVGLLCAMVAVSYRLVQLELQNAALESAMDTRPAVMQPVEGSGLDESGTER